MRRPRRDIAALRQKREPKILEALKDHGPVSLTQLSKLIHSSADSVGPQVEEMEQRGLLIQDITGEDTRRRRMVRLPTQEKRTKFSSRGLRIPGGPIGVEPTQELLDRALAVFESGKCLGMVGLARELKVGNKEDPPTRKELAEAIAAIGRLRTQGRIFNYFRDTYTATVPHPKNKAA